MLGSVDCYCCGQCETFEYYLQKKAWFAVERFGATKLVMTEVEAAKRLLSTAKGKFTRAANNPDQAIDTGAPTKTIENRYGELKTAWNETQDKHDDFVKLLPSEELDEGWIEDLNKTFSEVRADRHLEEAIKTKEQEKELKIFKETEEAEMKARQLAEITNKEESEKAREREEKRIEELLTRRHHEEIKFRKSIEAIEEIVARWFYSIVLPPFKSKVRKQKQ